MKKETEKCLPTPIYYLFIKNSRILSISLDKLVGNYLFLIKMHYLFISFFFVIGIKILIKRNEKIVLLFQERSVMMQFFFFVIPLIYI